MAQRQSVETRLLLRLLTMSLAAGPLQLCADSIIQLSLQHQL